MNTINLFFLNYVNLSSKTVLFFIFSTEFELFNNHIGVFGPHFSISKKGGNVLIKKSVKIGIRQGE